MLHVWFTNTYFTIYRHAKESQWSPLSPMNTKPSETHISKYYTELEADFKLT
jgi:hypothetical protein